MRNGFKGQEPGSQHKSEKSKEGSTSKDDKGKKKRSGKGSTAAAEGRNDRCMKRKSMRRMKKRENGKCVKLVIKKKKQEVRTKVKKAKKEVLVRVDTRKEKMKKRQ